MCYNPYDHNAMLRDVSARTAGVHVPNLRLMPAFGALARLAARIFQRSRPLHPEEQGAPVAAE